MKRDKFYFRVVAKTLCALCGMAACAATAQAHSMNVFSLHGGGIAPNDLVCAIHTAYGETRGLGKVEAATVVNGLWLSARRAGRSICAEAHRRYKPKPGKTPDIIAAVQNVFIHHASWVPTRFRVATEFRAPHVPRLHSGKFLCLGQLTRGGNVFYAALSHQ